MSEKIDFVDLKHLLKGVTLLYVEDNVNLARKVTHFFEKFFAPDRENLSIVSLNDITQLNFLALYDARSDDYGNLLKDIKNIINFLEVTHAPQVKIKLHNYYLMDFKKQTIEIMNPKMIKSTPIDRKYITPKPSTNHAVTLSYNEHKFDTKIVEKLFIDYISKRE